MCFVDPDMKYLIAIFFSGVIDNRLLGKKFCKITILMVDFLEEDLVGISTPFIGKYSIVGMATPSIDKYQWPLGVGPVAASFVNGSFYSVPDGSARLWPRPSPPSQ